MTKWLRLSFSFWLIGICLAWGCGGNGGGDEHSSSSGETPTSSGSDGIQSDNSGATGSDFSGGTSPDENQPPLFETIPEQQGQENRLLEFTLVASDPDGDKLIYSAVSLPGGSSFTPEFHRFSWTPNFDQAGSFKAVFSVSDDGQPALSDLLDVAIEIGNTNRAPVFSSIGGQTVVSGEVLTFSVRELEEISLNLEVSDPDGDSITLTLLNAPTGVSLDPTLKRLTWTPASDAQGTFPIRLNAADNGKPSPLDTKVEILIRVINTNNNPPSLEPIGKQAITPFNQLAFRVQASDPDGDTLLYTLKAELGELPTGISFNDLTGDFVWTPTAEQVGEYHLIFTVADNDPDMPLSQQETVIIEVRPGNQPPKFAPIGNKDIQEGDLLSFEVKANDDGGASQLIFIASGLPAGAFFNTSRHMFTWTPGYTQAGSYSVTFTVFDSAEPPLFDTLTVPVTVRDKNRSPQLQPVGDKSVNEGEPLGLTLLASDPDGDSLTFFVENRPEGAVMDLFKGNFSWTPGYDQAGTYAVTFGVRDDGSPQLSTTETITIEVVDINRPPKLAPIGNKTVNIGSELKFTVNATDPDNQPLTYTVSGLPPSALFNPVSHVFSWTPQRSDTGNVHLTFRVYETSNPDNFDEEEIIVTVGEGVNHPPEITPIDDQIVAEGDRLQFRITANDPDGDKVEFSANQLPKGATLSLDGQFDFQPTYDQAGVYNPAVIACDASECAKRNFSLAVLNTNRPPVLSPIGNKDTAEGVLLTFTLTANDPDGDRLTFLATNVPAGAQFDSDTAVFHWTPDFLAAGQYTLHFSVTDSANLPLSDSEVVIITIHDTPRPPVLGSIGNKIVNEGDLLTFVLAAESPDGLTLTYSATGLPNGATLDRQTGIFRFTPDFDQGRSEPYLVTFSVSDSRSQPLTDSETISLAVTDVNRPPVFEHLDDFAVDTGVLLIFSVAAVDPDSDLISYSATQLPAGATFNVETLEFRWKPTAKQAGDYEIIFIATDNGKPAQSAYLSVFITVNAVNHAPIFSAIPDQSVNEGEELSLNLDAVDPDGDTLTFSASSLPTGADLNKKTGQFRWIPDYDQAGPYEISFTVSDGSEQANQLGKITVQNVNRPPKLTKIKDQQIAFGNPLDFTVSATDPDNDRVTFVALDLPEGAKLDPDSGLFSWIPTLEQIGTYTITVSASDDGQPPLADQQDVQIEVLSLPPASATHKNNTQPILAPDLDFPSDSDRSDLNWAELAVLIDEQLAQAHDLLTWAEALRWQALFARSIQGFGPMGLKLAQDHIGQATWAYRQLADAHVDSAQRSLEAQTLIWRATAWLLVATRSLDFAADHMPAKMTGNDVISPLTSQLSAWLAMNAPCVTTGANFNDSETREILILQAILDQKIPLGQIRDQDRVGAIALEFLAQFRRIE